MPGFEGTLHEYKTGSLHSGSKHGPVVKNRKQALAIAFSQARKEGDPMATLKDHLKHRMKKD